MYGTTVTYLPSCLSNVGYCRGIIHYGRAVCYSARSRHIDIDTNNKVLGRLLMHALAF